MMIQDKFMRDEILETISLISPFDTLEEEHINFTKKWIASGSGIYRIAPPNIPEIHLVSYFVVVDPSKNALLLVDHKKANLWLPAGGHVEINEHPKETVKREIREELGVDAEFLLEDPFFLTVTKTTQEKDRHVDVSLWYVLKGSSNVTLIFDTSEFYQIGWFHYDAIPFEKADPHMQRFVNKFSRRMQ